MEAIGMIETKGLVASIEAADAMIKAANVRLLSLSFVGGGLVTVIVTGDVGAVKAATDAGAAAAQRIGELFGAHVIPRPAVGTEAVLEEPKSAPPKAVRGKAEQKPGSAEEPGDTLPTVPEPPETPEPLAEPDEAPEPPAEPDKAPEPPEAPEPPAEPDKAPETGAAQPRKTTAELEGMRVSELCQYLRGRNHIGIPRNMIKFAKKEELLAAIEWSHNKEDEEKQNPQ